MTLIGDSMEKIFHPRPEFRQNAHVKSFDQYQKLYRKSIDDPESFWSEILKDFYLHTPAVQGKCLQYNFDVRNGPIDVKWFEGAKTNVCYNVLDRIINDKGKGDEVAFYWEGNTPGYETKITYNELLTEVCKFANVLKSLGVKKGDCVAMYMPMILELVVAMLACARIGAVHSVVFGGMSADSLSSRMVDGQCHVVITADQAFRGDKSFHLKEIVDKAVLMSNEKGLMVNTVITVHNNGRKGEPYNKGKNKTTPSNHTKGRDYWWHEQMAVASDQCDPEWMEAEEPLFIGYLLYAATTFKYAFDYHDGDVYWCTADIGWITGHSFVVYGPMANGATIVLFEGVPTYPDPGRCWEITDKYNVTIFYTAPTLIRTLMKFGEKPVRKHSRKSLRILGTAGEPINPEAWLFYYYTIGDGRCPIVDTFWQTETAGPTITPLPGAISMKPGSATVPFFGIDPVIVDDEGQVLEGECEGSLVFKGPWPSIMRTIYGDHQRYENTYFRKFPGYYLTGDGCRRDKDGYLWITGRIDDMFNMSGHLLSTAEIESVIYECPEVAEAAAVAFKHVVKGQCCFCFVTMVEGVVFTEEISKAIKQHVRNKIGAYAQPDFIRNTPRLPKTRSGKIMRRVLRKVAENNPDLGDISTMADPGVVEELFERISIQQA
ncbi:Acetyl-coenzyme A synthetase, cytoplasmic [Holothuria leucospilota]|uniref:Acetyl-coenzyme A synthetase n=1 Tax=Holothuria leucospilota TaxID=206669 RepID=A0A9Q1BVS5_HOLLE|nr:Acetyl-coenzyme A synthetase, cytoplasmic [Holothuria leucospilota]